MKPIIVEVNLGTVMTYLRVDAGRLFRLTSGGWQLTEKGTGIGGRVLTESEQAILDAHWGRP